MNDLDIDNFIGKRLALQALPTATRRKTESDSVRSASKQHDSASNNDNNNDRAELEEKTKESTLKLQKEHSDKTKSSTTIKGSPQSKSKQEAEQALEPESESDTGNQNMQGSRTADYNVRKKNTLGIVGPEDRRLRPGQTPRQPRTASSRLPAPGSSKSEGCPALPYQPRAHSATQQKCYSTKVSNNNVEPTMLLHAARLTA